jgi:hypothetical protein
MTFQLARGVAELLTAQRFPVRVHYGPEQFERGAYDDAIVIERDREGGDAVDPVRGAHSNPRAHGTRQIGMIAHVYARSSLEGARALEHEWLCDQYVDALIVAIRKWSVATRSGVAWGAGGFVDAAERGDVETWPGVVYRLRFRIARGVADRTFEGDAIPTAEITGVANQTHTRINSGDDPEIGCGA